MAITTGGILRKMSRPQLHLLHVQHLAKKNEMENFKLDLIAAKRQHFISRLQWVEPAISSPPGNAALPKTETFLVICVHCYGKMPRLAVLAAIKASSFVRNCQQENENDH
jgi:hypothetical protein